MAQQSVKSEQITTSPDDEKESTTNSNIPNPSKSKTNTPPYQQCDIYRLFNDLENVSTLLLDVRSKKDYTANHVMNSEHFDIPNNVTFTTPQQLMQRLNPEITEFKKKVAAKLKHTKPNELLIHCYGDETVSQKTEKFNILYQLSRIFKLQPSQLQILRDPGFSAFEDRFPFLCSKQIAFEENAKATEFRYGLSLLV